MKEIFPFSAAEGQLNLDPADLEDLRHAVRILEKPRLSIRLMNRLGSPIDRALDYLPAPVSESVHEASRKAIERALQLAISSLAGDELRRTPANAAHKLLCSLSGAVGGGFGVPALIVELPLSTTIILRSIADIARSEGEDIGALEGRMACLEVFALGGRNPADDMAETGYYAIRAALARAVSEATRHLAQRGLVSEGGPVLVRLVSQIASRFGVIVSQKLAAQTVPLIGAVGGAAVNLMFANHFQAMAKGHFIVRRLERAYGKPAIESVYERLRDEVF